jgi:hypothetical protein
MTIVLTYRSKEERRQDKKEKEAYYQTLWDSLSPFQQINYGSINEMVYDMFFKDIE